MVLTTLDTLPAQRPSSIEQLAAAVREAQHNGRYARVAGTDSLPLREFPGDRQVQLISTARLNKLVEHAVGDMTVIVQAGITDTPALRLIPGSEQMKTSALARNPLQRLTTVEDVANIIFLLSLDEASWINGALLRADGGEHIGSA